MEHFNIAFEPMANFDTVILAGNARFTVLTPRLIRMEYSPTARFEDRASQVMWYRQQPIPQFSAQHDEDDVLTLTTEFMLLRYDTRIGEQEGFTPESLQVQLRHSGAHWSPGEAVVHNLKGTARTLDHVEGAVPLTPGLLSRAGWALVDDSRSLVFNAQGWLVPRDGTATDWYFFAYGEHYQAALDDYFAVAGEVPMLPRWALGNWWSRYWEYTQDELLALVADFKAQDFPLSVCIIDMDWHITDTGNASRGWTGYTWNRELFPDPQALLDSLHADGLRTALNLHPADGVHPHEEQYAAMAAALGVDNGQPIAFKIGDPTFTEAYFRLLHHAYEAMGVDFWWLDWQQGIDSGVTDLDPLWWLNHLHFFDLGRDGNKRPFIFSRWGGLGNHRYPIGFSGDTVATWTSLAFQPYFTSTSANVGYGWWSHDIGGHYRGPESDELFVRWIQFGVFSPVMRIHATKNPFIDRRPWQYQAETQHILRDFMQLRHALIPYLYSMSWRTTTQNRQPLVPMYHLYPDAESAYACSNQYSFGSELIAAPFVDPASESLNLSRQVVWLPDVPGGWYHFFDGTHYEADTWEAVYGELSDVPVFAKAGAIVPLAPKQGWGGVANPVHLDLHLFPGADGTFTLYEDDGVSVSSPGGMTPFILDWQAQQMRFTIGAVQGALTHVPVQRSYTLYAHSLADDLEIEAALDGQPLDVTRVYEEHTVTWVLSGIVMASSQTLVFTITGDPLLRLLDRRVAMLEKLARNITVDSRTRLLLHEMMARMLSDFEDADEIMSLLDDVQQRALLEVLTGAGCTRFAYSHQAQPPVVMWNNGRLDHVRYLATESNGWSGGEAMRGTVPRCMIWSPGSEPTRHTYRHWLLNFHYGELFAVQMRGEVSD